MDINTSIIRQKTVFINKSLDFSAFTEYYKTYVSSETRRKGTLSVAVNHTLALDGFHGTRFVLTGFCNGFNRCESLSQALRSHANSERG